MGGRRGRSRSRVVRVSWENCIFIGGESIAWSGKLGPLDLQVSGMVDELASQIVRYTSTAFITARKLTREFPVTRCRIEQGSES